MTSTSPANIPTGVLELAARTLEVQTSDVTISRVTGDASTRSYFRASADDRSAIIALYSSAFDENTSAAERLAAAEARDPSSRLTFANDPCAHIETTLLFLEAGLPVPKLLGCSGADAVLLLEDVGDTRLQDWLADHSESEAVEAYREAMRMLIDIQGATRTVCDRGSICSRLAFDEAKLRWELGFFFANYFNRHLRVRLEAEVANAVQADFKALCSELASRPRVLTHRDYHARNLMMHGGRMCIIDFQDARMGPASYDVASLLSDPYSPLSRENARALSEEFVDLKARSLFPLPDPEDFRVELHLMTAQRMLKAVGTYASQAVAGNQVYLPYIRPAVERATSAMGALDRFAATRKLLEQTLS